MIYALHVVEEEAHTFYWSLIELDGERFEPHLESGCEFPTYADALNAGTLALAAADKQLYAKKVAEPGGDADCSAAGTPPT